MDYKKLMDKSREWIHTMSDTEHDSGVRSPEDDEPSQLLICAMQAIEAGVTTNDWSCVTDGQVMLERCLKFLWWMESELKTIWVDAVGCAQITMDLYALDRELIGDEFIAETTYKYWQDWIEKDDMNRRLTWDSKASDENQEGGLPQ